MKKHTMQPDSVTHAADTAPQLFDNWFDPIEFGVRSRVRVFIETMMEEELDAVLSRPRYGRRRIAPGAGKEAGTLEGSPAIVMATVRARFWERSAQSRYLCRAHD
jgi:hypothetical protein